MIVCPLCGDAHDISACPRWRVPKVEGKQMTEIEQLREEINKLRERVAVLENRANMPVRDGHPLWQPVPVSPPYWQWPSPGWVTPTVTC